MVVRGCFTWCSEAFCYCFIETAAPKQDQKQRQRPDVWFKWVAGYSAAHVRELGSNWKNTQAHRSVAAVIWWQGRLSRVSGGRLFPH